MRYLNSLPVWQYFRIALLPDAICTVLNIVNPFKKRMDNQGWINYEAVAQDLQAMHPDSRIEFHNIPYYEDENTKGISWDVRTSQQILSGIVN
ncbi:hypothetical protein CW696_01825 [ANME-2 cluster archaeon]|nr:MAG: hypothetical protein CW696_01825 [ANME-2 cluster archaeon]